MNDYQEYKYRDTIVRQAIEIGDLKTRIALLIQQGERCDEELKRLREQMKEEAKDA